MYFSSIDDCGGEMVDQKPRFFVAVHVGAGYHAPSNEKALRSAMKRACLAAASLLRKSSCSIDAVSVAIQVLEVMILKEGNIFNALEEKDSLMETLRS